MIHSDDIDSVDNGELNPVFAHARICRRRNQITDSGIMKRENRKIYSPQVFYFLQENEAHAVPLGNHNGRRELDVRAVSYPRGRVSILRNIQHPATDRITGRNLNKEREVKTVHLTQHKPTKKPLTKPYWTKYEYVSELRGSSKEDNGKSKKATQTSSHQIGSGSRSVETREVSLLWVK